jgi:hypothetical protein
MEAKPAFKPKVLNAKASASFVALDTSCWPASYQQQQSGLSLISAIMAGREK